MRHLSLLLVGLLLIFSSLLGVVHAEGPDSSGDRSLEPAVAACPESEVYAPGCDVDQDSQITVTDIQLVASKWDQQGIFTDDSWKLTGNAGTSPDDNYLGTTDGATLVIQPEDGNVAIGIRSTSAKLQVDADSGVGIYGTSAGAIGVYGQSYIETGVFGFGPTFGVHGIAGGTNPNRAAIYGDNRGSTTGGYAGHFIGTVLVEGTLIKSAGSFRIDHPLDPANKYLSHAFVESPEMKNLYDGIVTTDADGYATVTLPDWFQVLNKDFRYQLTVVGQFAQAIIASELEDNQFTIQTDKPHVKVSWQVTGVRQDPYALENPIPVEEEKPQELRGRYIYPQGYGKSQELSISEATAPSGAR